MPQKNLDVAHRPHPHVALHALHALLDHASDVFITIRRTDRMIVAANRRARGLLGWQQSDLVDHSVDVLYPNQPNAPSDPDTVSLRNMDDTVLTQPGLY